MLRLAGAIDRLNGWVGRAVCWLTLLMVLLGAYNTVVRYLGMHLGAQLSSNAYLEMQWYLFSAVFLLGAANTLKNNAHVRVDVLFSRLAPGRRAWINLLGTLLLLLPFVTLLFWCSWTPVVNSWKIGEGSSDPGGLPRYLVKSLLPLACILLFLQGVSETIKHIAYLVKRAPVADEGLGRKAEL